MLTSRYEIPRVRPSCHRTSFPRWRFFLARIFSNSTIRHANTFENEFPSCCVAISNIQQNLFKYSKASHLSPYLAKIVFISTFRIEKMDLAERWRRESKVRRRNLGEYVYFPSGDRLRIISNEFYRFQGSGGGELASWNSDTIALECALVAMTRARVSKLSLSLSLSRCLSWPRKGVAPARILSQLGRGREEVRKSSTLIWDAGSGSILRSETSLYLPVGIVCQDALSTSGHELRSRQSHVIAKYRLNEIRGFRLFDPADRIASVLAPLWTQLYAWFSCESKERIVDLRGNLDLCQERLSRT